MAGRFIYFFGIDNRFCPLWQTACEPDFSIHTDPCFLIDLDAEPNTDCDSCGYEYKSACLDSHF
jgi:hypothetical protein